jgi:hypothetical protein
MMVVIAPPVVSVAGSQAGVVVAPFVSRVPPVIMIAAASKPCGLAPRECTTVNSRLPANIARKCDVLGGGLGSEARPVVAFRPVIMRKRVRHPACGNLALGRIFVLMRMRMPPKHELLDNEEHAKPDHQGNADGMRSAGPHAFHRLRQ